jgi:[ribosomal protein S18]-alanine N-acetyltransferase
MVYSMSMIPGQMDDAQTEPSANGTPAQIIIRPMALKDIDAVQVIDRLCFALPWPASAYRYELNENPMSRLWVAERTIPDGSPVIVGVVVLWFILDEAHVATIAVHPNQQRLGIGRSLMLAALRQAVANNSSMATLEVRTGNQAARQLYSDLGFEIVGRRPRYYRDNNEDALIMTVSPLGQTYLTRLENMANASASKTPANNAHQAESDEEEI